MGLFFVGQSKLAAFETRIVTELAHNVFAENNEQDNQGAKI